MSRLNWALSAYAGALSALVNSENLEDLMNEVCQAIVEQGMYVLAGVFLMKPLDPPDPYLDLAAAAGPALGYFDGLKLSWSAELPEGAGPTGTAMRNGTPYILQDTLTDLNYAPWRERGLRHGIRSSVTVPFKRDGRVIGGLVVYAKVSAAFAEKELEVFTQLAEQIAFAISLGEDRERLKAAEEKVRGVEQDFARMARISSLGEMLASFAHEINQPLAAIATNSEACLRWLEKEPLDLEEARSAVRRIARDVERAGNVIARTRALLSKGDVRKTYFDLNEAVSEVIAFAQGEQKMSQVRVRTDLFLGLPLIRGDKVQIQQVVLNLVLNGIDAMREVTGRARLLAVRTRLDDDSNALVEVEDSGTGLAPEAEGRIFERFFTTKVNGIGLGLSISRSIVEAHGGRLWASSALSRGAVFRFTLSIREEGGE